MKVHLLWGRAGYGTTETAVPRASDAAVRRQTDPTGPDVSHLTHTCSVSKGMMPLSHRFPLLCGSSVFNPLKRLVQTHS